MLLGVARVAHVTRMLRPRFLLHSAGVCSARSSDGPWNSPCDHCDVLRPVWDVLRRLRLFGVLVPRSGLGGAIAEWVLQRTLPNLERNGQEMGLVDFQVVR